MAKYHPAPIPTRTKPSPKPSPALKPSPTPKPPTTPKSASKPLRATKPPPTPKPQPVTKHPPKSKPTPTPKPRRRKMPKGSVKFDPNVTVRLYSKDEETDGNVLNMETQKLLKDCHTAHNKITDIINQNSVHRILKTTTVEPLIRVNDLYNHWWIDNSPMVLHSKLQNKQFLYRFIKMFDQYVSTNISKVGDIKPLMITSSRFKIYFSNVRRAQ
jgi:hypothetical protein